MRKALLPLTLALVAFAAGMFDVYPALAQDESDLYGEFYIPVESAFGTALSLSVTATVFLVLFAAILILAIMNRGNPTRK